MEGFNEIYYKYNKVVRSQVLYHCYDHNECDDLVQEVWFKISKLFYKYNGDGFPKWSKSIVRNVCLDNYRRKHTLSRTPVPLPQWEYSLSYDRAINIIGDSLGLLSKEQQDIIILKIYGLTFRDISHTLSIPFSATQTSYYRAIRVLKGVLNDYDLEV